MLVLCKGQQCISVAWKQPNVILMRSMILILTGRVNGAGFLRGFSGASQEILRGFSGASL
jgi:hypothetical protein